MTDLHEGCLDRTASDKEAGAVVYLMEELGDARMRCDQLIRGLNEGLKLIENSSHKDHFFEVAGHLIQSVPVLAFKLQKALDAVALAAGRIDYEELKRSLRPEKVQELEKVLEDVRIRQVQRMSPLQQLTPKHAADALRKVAWMARGDSGLPQYEVSRLVLALEDGLGVDGPEDISEGLEKLAEALEEAEGPNRVLVASTLRRMLGDALVEDFHKTEKRMQTRNAYAFAGKLSDEVLQMSEEKDVRKKFKAENPDITDADMKKIVEMWKEHKDSLKAAAWKAPVVAGVPSNPDMARLWRHLNDISSDASGLVRHATGDVAQGLKEIAAQAQKAMDLVTKHDKSMKSASDEDKQSRFEEGKPADPTKNMSPEDKKKWEKANEENKDKFKSASWKAPIARRPDRMNLQVGDKVFYNGHPATVVKTGLPSAMGGRGSIEVEIDGSPGRIKTDPGLDHNLTMFKGEKVPSLSDLLWKRDASDEDKQSRFEEGKPADPTKNMSPEDKKKWEESNEENKDKFKKDAWKADDVRTRIASAADFSRVVSAWLLNNEGDQLHKNVASLLKNAFKRAGLNVPEGRLQEEAHDLIYNFDGKTDKAAKDAWDSAMKGAERTYGGKSASDPWKA